MPLYDYDCAACGTRFEVVHGVHADPPTTCPVCGKGPVKKAFSAPTIHFKGSGWAKKERRATSAPSASTSKDGGAGSDPKGGDRDSRDGGSRDAKSGDAKSGDGGSSTNTTSEGASSSNGSTPASATSGAASSTD